MIFHVEGTESAKAKELEEENNHVNVEEIHLQKNIEGDAREG